MLGIEPGSSLSQPGALLPYDPGWSERVHADAVKTSTWVHSFSKDSSGAGKIAQGAKGFATDSDNLSSIPGAYVVERENCFLNIVL